MGKYALADDKGSSKEKCVDIIGEYCINDSNAVEISKLSLSLAGSLEWYVNSCRQ